MSFLERIFRKQQQSNGLSRFDKVLVSLKIDDAQALFVLLAEDGTVNRMGDGSVGCKDKDMFIGRCTDALFEKFMRHVDPAILAHQGAYDVPEKKGKVCELSLLFNERTSEKTEGFRIRYGSDSQGVPREIADLVVKMVEMTNPWHELQKKNQKTAQPGATDNPGDAQRLRHDH